MYVIYEARRGSTGPPPQTFRAYNLGCLNSCHDSTQVLGAVQIAVGIIAFVSVIAILVVLLVRGEEAGYSVVIAMVILVSTVPVGKFHTCRLNARVRDINTLQNVWAMHALHCELRKANGIVDPVTNCGSIVQVSFQLLLRAGHYLRCMDLVFLH